MQSNYVTLGGELQELVVTYKDRLLRFGWELFLEIVRNSAGKILVLNECKGETPAQELAADLVSIITVFTARVHSLRSHRNKRKGGEDKSAHSWKEAVRRCKDLTDSCVSKREGGVGNENTPAE